MPRPTTKADLIQTANDQFAKLWTLIGEMSDEEKCADIVPNERDKNVRDILVHLYEWHCLLLNWIRTNTNGKPASFLPAPYNWKTNLSILREIALNILGQVDFSNILKAKKGRFSISSTYATNEKIALIEYCSRYNAESLYDRFILIERL